MKICFRPEHQNIYILKKLFHTCFWIVPGYNCKKVKTMKSMGKSVPLECLKSVSPPPLGKIPVYATATTGYGALRCGQMINYSHVIHMRSMYKVDRVGVQKSFSSKLPLGF